jgi:pimeloyl-ACP methyl ester carboxylesterase
MSIELPNEFRLAGVEHLQVALDGFTAHVAQKGQGEPLVMLHGWPQHWWAWQHLIDPFAAAGWRVICPDLRGFGWSGTPGYGYDSDTFAADLIALLDALGLPRVNLLGHDWGGYTGFLACLAAPERFRRFVAMGTPSPLLQLSLRKLATLWRYWYQQPIALPVLGPWLIRAVKVPHNPIWAWIGLNRLPREVAHQYLRQFDDPARVAASVALYRHSIFTVTPRLLFGYYRKAHLRVPTLILHGTAEHPTHPVLHQGLAVRADQLDVKQLAGVGHFLFDEQPDLVFEHVSAFLAR